MPCITTSLEVGLVADVEARFLSFLLVDSFNGIAQYRVRSRNRVHLQDSLSSNLFSSELLDIPRFRATAQDQHASKLGKQANPDCHSPTPSSSKSQHSWVRSPKSSELVRLATGAARVFPRARKSGKQNRRQNRDDGDDHQ